MPAQAIASGLKMAVSLLIIVTARNEQARLPSTLTALAEAFPGASLWVADDCSTDATRRIAIERGAEVISPERTLGKGGAATLAAHAALATVADPDATVVVLCDGDLGESAGRLDALVAAVSAEETDLAVALFSRKTGGGFGLALGFARFAIRRRCGLRMSAPISGQRVMRANVLAQLLPFADGFGMEVGMTIDAARRGLRVAEIEVDLSHRATKRTLRGFVHRGRQLIDFVRVYRARGYSRRVRIDHSSG